MPGRISIIMHMSRRTAGWSAALVAVSSLGLAITRQRQQAAAFALKNKVVLITGGSRGLGFALASEMASQGARLVLTARDLGELKRARARLVAEGSIEQHDVFVQSADVSKPDEVRALVEAGTAYFGQIDVLINNAGIIVVGPVESQTLASFQQAMNINFYGALHTTLAVLPQMLARGGGAIVNIASIGGKVAFPHLLPYTASKFALVGWSQGLRAELGAHGIRVTTVTPGVMRTGSHVQARYTGNTAKEYRWFAGAASLPVTACNPTRAARKVTRALIHNLAEVAIGLQAIAASRLANVSPELTAALLSAANSFLPQAPDTHGQPNETDFFAPDPSVAGKIHRGSLPGALERLSTSAMNRYNQDSDAGSSHEETRRS